MKISGDENNEFLLTEISARLRAYRIDRGITQKQLAEMAGVSVKSVERMEKGDNIRLTQLFNVLRVLGLTSNLNLLIPEQMLHPTDIFEGIKPRQRVSVRKSISEEAEWKWGDEL